MPNWGPTCEQNRNAARVVVRGARNRARTSRGNISLVVEEPVMDEGIVLAFMLAGGMRLLFPGR
jgi:hypothetical protein